MPDNAVVVVHESKDDLVVAVARRFITTVAELQSERDVIHVCLTGGSVGIAILAAVADDPTRDAVAWDRIHFWWGDERWVADGHADRNDQQANDALLSRVAVPAEHVHAFPSTDGPSLDDAAAQYADELQAYAGTGANAPSFDITFLGVGPDGHVASLFPHHEQLNAVNPVVAVRNSPKPPPERLSLTLPVINDSARVWLVVAGADKASPLGLALAGASRHLVPVAGVRGRRETAYFVDTDAAADVPRELIVESNDR